MGHEPIKLMTFLVLGCPNGWPPLWQKEQLLLDQILTTKKYGNDNRLLRILDWNFFGSQNIHIFLAYWMWLSMKMLTKELQNLFPGNLSCVYIPIPVGCPSHYWGASAFSQCTKTDFGRVCKAGKPENTVTKRWVFRWDLKELRTVQDVSLMMETCSNALEWPPRNHSNILMS
jgi:hypothetical protein